MCAWKSLVGDQFGDLTVVALDKSTGDGRRWRCACVCGAVTFVMTRDLTSGHSQSCGCSKEHGQTKTRKYRAWKAMKGRCNSPGAHDACYENVTYCPKWEDWEAFDKDVPEPTSEQHTLDRIDGTKGYEPGNIRWATRAEQSRNKSDTVRITLNGITKSQAEWCRELDIDWRTVTTRRRRGWSIEKALLTPVDTTKRNRRAK